jgi:hypothetical protein
MEFNEVQIKSTSVRGKGCQGCVKHNKDIMVTLFDVEDNVTDMFLTQDEAVKIYTMLGRNIAFNELDI